MKLIELLVKHMTVWPTAHTNHIYQCGTGQIRSFAEGQVQVDVPLVPEETYVSITYAQWEAARKKWIRNRGTKKSPVVDKERRIDIRLRDGCIHTGCNAKFCWWNHLGSINDIMAWRFH